MSDKNMYEVQLDLCRQLGAGRMLVEADSEWEAVQAVGLQVDKLYNLKTELGHFANVGEVHKVNPDLYASDDLGVMLDYEKFGEPNL